MEKFEDNYDIIYYIAESNYSLSDFEETIRWYEKALEVDPEFDIILSYMADVYSIMEDYDNAISFADQALAINHENATATAVKNTIKNKQRPVVEQLKEFIEGNYLYYNDNIDIDQLFTGDDMSNAEIEHALNQMKKVEDEFTFLIYGEDYAYDYDLDTSNVEYENLGEMKYIRIYNFNLNTDHQVVQILDSIDNPEDSVLTIDLRMNGGGLTDAANNILDALLPSCVTCTLIDKDGYTSNYYSDEYHVKFKEIYILVDGYSASASELLTLGLKTFLDNVTIVGDTTYGKGVGQWVAEYKSNELVVYLVNHYWNVREQNIMDTGIEADILVNSRDLADYLAAIEVIR